MRVPSLAEQHKTRAISREIQAIERACGIDKEADRVREGPFPLHVSSETPFGTPESLQEGREERLHEADYIRRRIRDLYFSVADIEARQLLIQKTRELDAFRKSSARQEQRQADAALIVAMDASLPNNWALQIAGFACGWWLADWWVGGVCGAIATWRLLLPSAKRRREQNVVEARREADLLEETTAEILADIPIFSELEELTGQDEEAKARRP